MNSHAPWVSHPLPSRVLCRNAREEDDLQQIATTATEHEQMSRIRILSEFLFGLHRQRVESAPHIRQADCEPHPRVARRRDHAVSRWIRPTTEDNAVGPSTRIRRPSDRVMSTRCALTAQQRGSSASCASAEPLFSSGGASISTGRKYSQPRLQRQMRYFPQGQNGGL